MASTTPGGAARRTASVAAARRPGKHFIGQLFPRNAAAARNFNDFGNSPPDSVPARQARQAGQANSAAPARTSGNDGGRPGRGESAPAPPLADSFSPARKVGKKESTIPGGMADIFYQGAACPVPGTGGEGPCYPFFFPSSARGAVWAGR